MEAAWSIDVLVVDDDEADTCLIMDVLRRHPRIGEAVSIACPDEALFLLAQGWRRPNLILLDVHMPKVNGFKFMEALREIPRLRDTAVVLLTTSRHARDVEAAAKSQARQYIVKPDDYEELAGKLDGVIKQALTGVWNR